MKQNHNFEIGMKFGRLTILEKVESEKRKDGHGTFSRYLCKCDCGKDFITRKHNIVMGITKSCGCLLSETIRNRAYKASYKEKGLAGLLRVYRAYQKSAEKRSHLFNLTLEEFKILTKANCFYCGMTPNTLATTGNSFSNYIYNGIDRKNNDLGYELNNCVTCCQTCNLAKHTKTFEEFINWINQLVNFKKEHI